MSGFPRCLSITVLTARAPDETGSAEHGKRLTLTDYLIARAALVARMADFHRRFELLVTPTPTPTPPLAAQTGKRTA
ncbi:hypothetical protein [Salinicola endophyticus]|uniref:Uncharacterized protein n=1 Tax=Salinicola endophyticus TaxID=1949083 RepID=A0AB74UDP5_9GAMM